MKIKLITPDPSNARAWYGADRRLVVAPVVDCGQLSKKKGPVPILAWACLLMLEPTSGSTLSVEYEGLASDPTSPCVSSGIPGASTSSGPMVPALVQ